VRQHRAIVEIAEARQHGADLRRDGVISVAVPTQVELGLLAEVLEIRHGRNEGTDQ
jgi:hypothetical protein